MKKYFENIGEIKFEKLTVNQINECAELIKLTYENENIWSDYSKEEATEELICSFTNTIYKPIYFVALLNNKIIGLASYMWSHCSSNVFELSFNTIHPDYQRKGIGTYLTYLRCKEILELDRQSLIITVARRPKVLEKFNFKTICKIKNEDEESDYMICKASEINLVC